jgi:hypothetical protein
MTPLAVLPVALVAGVVAVLDVLDADVVLLAVEDAPEDPPPQAARSIESAKAALTAIH